MEIIIIDDLEGLTHKVDLSYVGAVYEYDDVVYFGGEPFRLSSARPALPGTPTSPLIAASPDLLEACQCMFMSLSAFLDYASNMAGMCYGPKAALEKGRAAIAKAYEAPVRL